MTNYLATIISSSKLQREREEEVMKGLESRLKQVNRGNSVGID